MDMKRGLRSLLLIGAIALPGVSLASTLTVLDFESLTGVPYIPTGFAVPAYAQLSDQFLATHGVRFASGAPYVAVVNLGLGHATSGINGLGGTTATGTLTYDHSYPITASFFAVSDPSQRAVTDFVSLRGDNFGGGRDVILEAYDLEDNLLASMTASDFSGTTLSISTAGIHSVRFIGTTDMGGVAIDDFSFNTPLALVIPEPGSLALVSLALAGAGIVGRRRRSA